MDKYHIRLFFVWTCIAAFSPMQEIVAEEERYFSYTELQVHADLDREPIKSDIWTLTLEHTSEWKYGDNYFFLDIEGKPDSKAEADTLYFEYAPRFSLDNIFGSKMLPGTFLGELYATIQYNDSGHELTNAVWLYGISLDFTGHTNFGFSNLHFLVREEKTQAISYQLTLAWGQPFYVGDWAFAFSGFLDLWEDNHRRILLTEPQLRMSLSNLFGRDNFLSNASIGTELEISKDFFGKGYGWEVNPTLFFVFPFD